MYAPSIRLQPESSATAPTWALNASRIAPEDVLHWVEGKRGSQWFAPALILTADELVWIRRGLLRKSTYRVPRGNISSVYHTTGIKWETIIFNVAGGGLPDAPFRLNWKRREEAGRLVDALRE